jgi:DNA-binding CsgD family transcriptional regulator
MDTDTRASAPASTLSPHERAVLEIVATGLTNAEAAQRLGVSVHAIKFHLASIYRKLSLSNRTEAAVWLLRDREDHDPVVDRGGKA